jgi:hypothetical protein
MLFLLTLCAHTCYLFLEVNFHFSGPLVDSFFLSIVLDFRTFLSVDFIYSVYPCPVETSRESVLLLWFFYTLFTLCPFETKMEEYVRF